MIFQMNRNKFKAWLIRSVFPSSIFVHHLYYEKAHCEKFSEDQEQKGKTGTEDRKNKPTNITSKTVGGSIGTPKAQDFIDVCESYNSTSWKLNFNLRKNGCEGERYCHFIGQALLGKCVFGSKDQRETKKEPTWEELAEVGAFNTNLFLGDPFSPEYHKLMRMFEDDQINNLLKTAAGEAIAQVATENMKEAATATQKAAKEMLQKILLEDEELRTQTGQALRSLFADESITTPIVWTICDNLSTEFVSTNSSKLLAKTVVWLLKDYDLTRDEVADLIAYLIALDITRSSCSFLLDWVLLLTGEGTVLDLVAQVSAKAIPDLQEITDDCFKYYANEYLKSPDTKEKAKGVVLDFLDVQIKKYEWQEKEEEIAYNRTQSNK